MSEADKKSVSCTQTRNLQLRDHFSCSTVSSTHTHSSHTYRGQLTHTHILRTTLMLPLVF